MDIEPTIAYMETVKYITIMQIVRVILLILFLTILSIFSFKLGQYIRKREENKVKPVKMIEFQCVLCQNIVEYAEKYKEFANNGRLLCPFCNGYITPNKERIVTPTQIHPFIQQNDTTPNI